MKTETAGGVRAATLGLGFGLDMLPGHAKFVRFSVELRELIAWCLSLIDIPCNTCHEPLVANPTRPTSSQTVENSQTRGQMLQLFALVEDH